MTTGSSRVAVVVQARMSSTRLPGKVLRPLAGAPALARMMERVARVSLAQSIVVATSDRADDDPLAEMCGAHGIPISRGPLDDVLARFVQAVPPEFDTVVRLTGDCPLIDPALVDRHVELFLRDRSRSRYVTNAVERTFPDGLDVEVVARDLLVRAEREADSAFDREHVLTWAREHARLEPVTQPSDLSALRWTLDTSADYDAISAIYEALYPECPEFSSGDVYRLLVRRPELIRIEGRDELDPRERTSWVDRIRAHLESGESRE
jgi:spore coat polysaccharide biosynthesis protein SpsF